MLISINTSCFGAIIKPQLELKSLIPRQFPDGLQLKSLTERNNAKPWRMVSFMPDINSAKAIEKKVSVIRGIKALYAYPGSMYFANVKVEQSAPAQFKVDKQHIIEALQSNTDYRQYHLTQYFKDHPDKQQQVMATMLKGKDYFSLQCEDYLGYQYCIAAINDLQLHRGTISQVVIFVPDLQVTIVAYLLDQKNTHFDNIEEFTLLQDQFIKHYIEYLQHLNHY